MNTTDWSISPKLATLYRVDSCKKKRLQFDGMISLFLQQTEGMLTCKLDDRLQISLVSLAESVIYY